MSGSHVVKSNRIFSDNVIITTKSIRAVVYLHGGLLDPLDIHIKACLLFIRIALY